MNRATEVRLISMVIFGQLAHFLQKVPTPALNLLLPMNTPKPPPVLELTVLGFTGNHFDVFNTRTFVRAGGGTNWVVCSTNVTATSAALEQMQFLPPLSSIDQLPCPHRKPALIEQI